MYSIIKDLWVLVLLNIILCIIYDIVERNGHSLQLPINMIENNIIVILFKIREDINCRINKYDTLTIYTILNRPYIIFSNKYSIFE